LIITLVAISRILRRRVAFYDKMDVYTEGSFLPSDQHVRGRWKLGSVRVQRGKVVHSLSITNESDTALEVSCKVSIDTA